MVHVVSALEQAEALLEQAFVLASPVANVGLTVTGEKERDTHFVFPNHVEGLKPKTK